MSHPEKKSYSLLFGDDLVSLFKKGKYFNHTDYLSDVQLIKITISVLLF
jgi:hypothetical protein